MSKGGGGGSSTTTSKVEYPEWVDKAAKENLALAGDLANKPYNPYSGKLLADISPYSNEAQRNLLNLARSGLGYAETARATDQLMSDMRYSPASIGASTFNAPTMGAGSMSAPRMNAVNMSAGSMNAPMMNAASMNAANINRGAIDELSPANINARTNALMNPYQQNVIDATVKEMNDARLQTLAQTGDQAQAANAFGGSRHGIMEADVNSDYINNVGAMTANLRNQGFNTAQQAALQSGQFDAGVDQAVALANQQSQNLAGQQNLSALMQARANNQQAGLTANQQNLAALMQARAANQQAGMTAGANNQSAQLTANQQNLAADMQARQANLASQLDAAKANQTSINDTNQFNVQAGLDAQKQRMLASSMVPTAVQAERGLRTADASQLENIGLYNQNRQQQELDLAYNKWLEAQNYPRDMLNLRVQALGGTPYGSTTTGVQPVQGSNPLAGAMGGAMMGATLGSMMAPAGATGLAAVGGAPFLLGGALLGGLL